MPRRFLSTTVSATHRVGQQPVQAPIKHEDDDHHNYSVGGQVKVEYAFETARVKLYLPQYGETWFFVDKNTTIEEFRKQVQLDDSFVKDVKFYVKNPQTGGKSEINDQGDKLYGHLVGHEYRKLYIQLNDNIHAIPTVGTSNEHHSCSIQNEHWYDLCIK